MDTKSVLHLTIVGSLMISATWQKLRENVTLVDIKLSSKVEYHSQRQDVRRLRVYEGAIPFRQAKLLP